MADEEQKVDAAEDTENTESTEEQTSPEETQEAAPETAAEAPTEEAAAPAEEKKEEPKKESKPVSANLEEIIGQIEKLSVLELADLVHALEDRFGVTAAAPMAVA